MKTFKRWLYLTHRWLGIGLCLFLAMWFFSGVVMMYVGYPKLTEHERLSHLPSIAPNAMLSPAQAFARAGEAGPLRELSLSAGRAGRPMYQAWFEDGRRIQVDARDGSVPARADAAVALSSARVFAGPTVALRHEGMVDEDAFTHSRALDRHRPLHRIALADEAHTRLYVSSVTGEVVRDASRLERGWNYLGAWIHWLYPFRGTVLDTQWANIVNVLTILGLVLTLTGTVVGVLRWRFTRPYRSGSRTPYPGALMRWHHISGLLFAVITLTWLFSGLMSMGPWGFLRDPGPTQHLARMHGPALQVQALTATPAALLEQGSAFVHGSDGIGREAGLGRKDSAVNAHVPLEAYGKDVRELRWARRLNQDVVLLVQASGALRMIRSHDGAALSFSDLDVTTAAARLFDAPLLRTERLDHYDLYYYDRAPHTMLGGRGKPLPVIRAVYGDPGETWVHIDARTAQVLGRTDVNGRLRRWLFQMLHSWDWLPLLQRRPLWDVVMVALSLGGLALSATGVVIGVRRLRERARRGWRNVSDRPG